MTNPDLRVLETSLVQMRAIHSELAARHAGLCVLHLDAAIAALESHLRRQQSELNGPKLSILHPAVELPAAE